MKLAEALMLRSDAKQKLASLYDRIKDNAIVQQGDKPHEDPAELLNEAAGVVDQIESLVIRINRANLENQLADGQTLMEAIAARDSLTKQHALLHAAIEGAKREPDRWNAREIKWVATVDVAKLQKQSDDLSKQIRELNAAIQQANWNVEFA